MKKSKLFLIFIACTSFSINYASNSKKLSEIKKIIEEDNNKMNQYYQYTAQLILSSAKSEFILDEIKKEIEQEREVLQQLEESIYNVHGNIQKIATSTRHIFILLKEFCNLGFITAVAMQDKPPRSLLSVANLIDIAKQVKMSDKTLQEIIDQANCNDDDCSMQYNEYKHRRLLKSKIILTIDNDYYDQIDQII